MAKFRLPSRATDPPRPVPPSASGQAPGPFGWIPPRDRTAKQWEAHEKALALALAPPEDCDRGVYTSIEEATSPRDFAICVLDHILAGEGIVSAIKACLTPGPTPPPPPPPPPGPTPGKKGYLWWPYTYGQSRHRMGDDSEGEGCTGAAWAAAARYDGMWFEEETTEVEPWHDASGWMQMTQRDEYRWSSGPWAKEKYGALGLLHLVSQVVPIKDADDAAARIMEGYTLTHASDYGTQTIERAGNPPVMLAQWDSSWPHQMSCSDCWEHPTLGLIFDNDNTWGPGAHPAPLSGEDPGGFWIPGKDYTRICKSGEVFGFKGFAGLTGRAIRQALDSHGEDPKRYNLKALAKAALDEFYRRIWQVTGSCVGAGGGQALMHLYGLELRVGQTVA